jgi:hypothetical protein
MLGMRAVLLPAVSPAHAGSLRLAATERIIGDEHLIGAAAAVHSMSVHVASATDHPADLAHIAGSLHDAPTGVTSARGAAPLMGLYRQAADEEGNSANLLRALHAVESNAAPDGCVANGVGSGAVGPFQFKRGTFRRYGVDANHDRVRDICSFADALFSAARYLRALGAGGLDDPNTRHALARYGTAPDRVPPLARR